MWRLWVGEGVVLQFLNEGIRTDGGCISHEVVTLGLLVEGERSGLRTKNG